MLKKILLPSFFYSMEYFHVHLVYEAHVNAPLHYYWMYPFERFIQYLKRKVSNKAHPVGSICEAYLAEEMSTFCSFCFEDSIPTWLHYLTQNNDGGLKGCSSCYQYFHIQGGRCLPRMICLPF